MLRTQPRVSNAFRALAAAPWLTPARFPSARTDIRRVAGSRGRRATQTQLGARLPNTAGGWPLRDRPINVGDASVTQQRACLGGDEVSDKKHRLIVAPRPNTVDHACDRGWPNRLRRDDRIVMLTSLTRNDHAPATIGRKRFDQTAGDTALLKRAKRGGDELA